MREERDSIGEALLPQNAYYGIETFRLIEAANSFEAGFPIEIPYNIVRVRHAQAIAYGRNKYWDSTMAAAIENAAERLVSGKTVLSEHIKTCPQHGGGARSLVLNIDEVLANLALENMGKNKGEYRNIAPIFQMDRGIFALETYMTAFHIAMIELLDTLGKTMDRLVSAMQKKELAFGQQETLSQIQFQKVGFTDIGCEFRRCYEGLLRSRQQQEWFRSMLLPCWKGPPEALLALREMVGIDLAICKSPCDFPWNVDLYVGLSALLRTTAMNIEAFCDKMRFLIGVSKEVEAPRIRTNPFFNPADHEFLILDTVSQLMFSIIGSDAVIVAATSAGTDSSVAYVPLFSTQIVWSGNWLKRACQLLEEKFVVSLAGNVDAGIKLIAETPLQAEKLITVLGFDRAVQVARIAALTEKPVRMVVKKMKLLTDEQLEEHLPEPE